MLIEDAPTLTLWPMVQPNRANPCRNAPTRLKFRIVRRGGQKYSDAAHAFALLRTGCNRPRRRTTEQRDELAPVHVWRAPAWQEIIWRAA